MKKRAMLSVALRIVLVLGSVPFFCSMCRADGVSLTCAPPTVTLIEGGEKGATTCTLTNGTKQTLENPHAGIGKVMIVSGDGDDPVTASDETTCHGRLRPGDPCTVTITWTPEPFDDDPGTPDFNDWKVQVEAIWNGGVIDKLANAQVNDPCGVDSPTCVLTPEASPLLLLGSGILGLGGVLRKRLTRS